MSGEAMAPLVQQFVMTRPVIAVDARGHGRTGDVPGPITHERMADDAAAVLRALHVRSPDVLGYSMGGTTAIVMAVRHPGLVGKQVIVSAVAERAGWIPQVLASFAEWKPEMFAATPIEREYRSRRARVGCGRARTTQRRETMSYIDGFIIPVATADKDKFVDHARRSDKLFLDYGATRIVEGWGDDIPDGKVTDFKKAVQAKDDETVVFSWVVWPDKATRDAGMKKMESNPEMMNAPMPPFDGKRMIFGGFAPIVEGPEKPGKLGYIDGFVTPVLPGKKDAYIRMAQDGAKMFAGYGALFDVEAWGDEVPDGKVTDFKRAVQAQEGETVVFSFLGWPDKATRDAGWKRMMEEMKEPADMPMDGKRMFWGGFTPIVELGGAAR